jgi:hypothetical protein
VKYCGALSVSLLVMAMCMSVHAGVVVPASSLWPSNRVTIVAPATLPIELSNETVKAVDLFNAAQISVTLSLVPESAELPRAEIREISKNDPECKPRDDNAPGYTDVGYQGRRVHRLCLTSKAQKGTVVHEILHMLGVHHEHQHCQAGEYLVVNWDEVKKHKNDKSNFEPYSCFPAGALLPFGEALGLSSARSMTYDPDSIMHYPASPKDSRLSLTDAGKKLVDDRHATVGQRTHLSDEDKRTICAIYGWQGTRPAGCPQPGTQ